MSAIEYGNLAEWVGAIGTVLAFMAAAIAFIYNLFDTRDESRKAQARLFDAWVTDVEFPHGSEKGPGDALRFTLIVEFANSSSQAFRDVMVSPYFFDDEPMTASVVGTVPPTSTSERWVRRLHTDIRNPSSQLIDVIRHRKDPSEDPWVRDLDRNLGLSMFTLELQFVDAAGRRWTRDRLGNLTADWKASSAAPDD